jgi:hypothetical protein
MHHGDALLDHLVDAGLSARGEKDRHPFPPDAIIEGEIATALGGGWQGGRQIDCNVATCEPGAQRCAVEDISGTKLHAIGGNGGRNIGSPHQRSHAIANRHKSRHQMSSVDTGRTQDCYRRHHPLAPAMLAAT